MNTPVACDGQCDRCPTTEAADVAAEGGYRGAAFAIRAAGYFLVPLVLAVAGAILAGPEAVGQTAGAVGGMAIGMVATSLLARWTADSCQPVEPLSEHS